MNASPLKSLRVSGSIPRVLAHLLEPAKLREILVKHFDVENATKPADERVNVDDLFVTLEPLPQELPTDEAKLYKLVDQVWGVPLRTLVAGEAGVTGSLQIRKVGAIDVYAVRLFDVGGYTAPMILEQFATIRPIDNSPWGEVGQVKIVFTLRGAVVTRSCTSGLGFRSIELGSSSIYKGEVAPTLATDGHLGFNPKRIIGLGGVVLRPHLGEDLEEGLEKGESITSIGNFLRESQDGRALAAIAKGAAYNRLFCLVLIFALLRLLVMREVEEIKVKLAAAKKG